MASKWIAAAVAAAVPSKRAKVRIDPVITDKRPALTDFLTEVDDGNGGTRELSVLMVTVTEGGLRVGLKDEAAGGWCWREGDTLSDCLNAIEKALQSGQGAFRRAMKARGRK